jgi:hypothetical protein
MTEKGVFGLLTNPSTFRSSQSGIEPATGDTNSPDFRDM